MALRFEKCDVRPRTYVLSTARCFEDVSDGDDNNNDEISLLSSSMTRGSVATKDCKATGSENVFQFKSDACSSREVKSTPFN
ncbi:hypothetical protein E4U41_002466 [Claviceps citrina]|nr:hypothetical protein E4U41_002466 [Claviceps citrina]